MAVGGVVKEKKKKKKIEEVEANDLLEDEGHKNDASVQTVVKNEFSEINIGGGDVDKDAPERKRKKKKKTKEMKQDVNGDILCHDASVQTTVKNEISKRDKQEGGAPAKKKKKMKKEVESLQEEVVEEGEQMDGESKEKKRRKKLKTSVGEAEERKKKVVVETKEEQMVNLGLNEEMESKKKKKKRKTEDDVTELDDGKIKKKRKKNKEINVNTGETDACEGKGQQEKKKKKKEMKASKETENEKRKSPAEESSSSGEKKSKKLKKKLASLDQGHAPVKETTAAADDVVEMEAAPVEKKRSKRNVRNKSKDKVKKTKLKEEDNEPFEESANDKKTDVVFLSEKRGNRDEISIDQGLGQWGSAQFESSDRQAKFLRLLGGFKKSSQPITGSSGSASMALGKEAQKTLQQGLLGEFERAQSRNVDFRNKGAGLGFTEPSNKKFTIDVNARNAIRFDD
ncbi:lysine-rich nucleolar protein 1 isoform X2 [Xyrauchen texanus]|uniref:lysine-rich nucleolar protein 1 isoform X2 n=1 Tax=Xyrauchen texanus TaxID=154827 RepID=UPI002242806D|nr:lysine-rich nucleolar protein 1 isoform X2 [Xyrauchen texanus]